MATGWKLLPSGQLYHGEIRPGDDEIPEPASAATNYVEGDRVAPLLRSLDTGRWQRTIFSPDLVNAPDSVLSIEHGRLVSRIIGGTGTQSNRREAWAIPGVPPSRYSTIRSRWASRAPADGTIEHGHMHRMQLGSDGKIRAVIVWDFSFGLILGGVWEADADGANFDPEQAPDVDSEAVLSAVRAGNVDTLTLAAGADGRWQPGDFLSVDLADAGYDGAWGPVTAVTDTTIAYDHLAADDASGGTGTITLLGRNGTGNLGRAWGYTALSRAADGRVTPSGVPTGHPFQTGDLISVDAADPTFDGRFAIDSVNLFTGQPTWIQRNAGAADAAPGNGTLSKPSPYWVESRLIPGGTDGAGILQARMWPDIGLSENGATGGPIPAGPPPWESRWARSWDIGRVIDVEPPSGVGRVAMVAAHHSSSSPVRYDNISAAPLHTR